MSALVEQAKDHWRQYYDFHIQELEKRLIEIQSAILVMKEKKDSIK